MLAVKHETEIWMISFDMKINLAHLRSQILVVLEVAQNLILWNAFKMKLSNLQDSWNS